MEELFHSVRLGQREFVVSVITELELMVLPIRQGDRLEMERVHMVLEAPGVHLVEMNRAIAHRAAQVRASAGLDLADAAIIATGIQTECDAIVGNDARCARRVKEIPYVLLDALVKEQTR
ncbi:MAG: PIN domain-containing protein [Dehalococcoidia bacterium]